MRLERHADTRETCAVHTIFRREYALMPSLVRGVSAGDEERFRIVADHLDFVNTVLHHHHRAEDKHLWPRLLDRAYDDIAPIVLMMQAQHEALETLIAEIRAQTKLWRDSAGSECAAALPGILKRMASLLNEHMDLEEQQTLPLAEKHITAAEWALMAQEGAADVPLEKHPVIFGMLMYEGDPGVVAHMLSRLPPQLRAIVTERATQAFASHCERVHGTRTPPRNAWMALPSPSR